MNVKNDLCIYENEPQIIQIQTWIYLLLVGSTIL